MSVVSEARVATKHGSRYLQQLCKHWSHNLAVDYALERGSVTFPHDARGASWAGDAVLRLEAEPDTLVCRVEASESAQLGAMKPMIERHLDRFAFREAPLRFDWRDDPHPAEGSAVG